ncbi:hypothetical protein GOODEAATRI_034158, partial [Goodea atripinnis]
FNVEGDTVFCRVWWIEGFRPIRGPLQQPHCELKMARGWMPHRPIIMGQQVPSQQKPPWLPVQQSKEHCKPLTGHSEATLRTLRVDRLTRWRVGSREYNIQEIAQLGIHKGLHSQ